MKTYILNDTTEDTILERDYSDNKKIKINLSAYGRYMKYRTSNYHLPFEEGEIKDDLTGKDIVNTDTGSRDKIKHVLRDWYGGFYNVIVTEDGWSIAWKNINCISSSIEEQIKENNRIFNIV